MPAGLKALTICCGESGLNRRCRRPPTTWSARAWSLAGRMPWRGARAEQARSAARRARPAARACPSWPISPAISAPADSAATSSRNRRGSARPSIRRSWSAWTSATRSASGAPAAAPSSKRRGLPRLRPLVVLGHREAVQPGVGGLDRPGLAVAPLVSEEQALGQREVVTARQPYAGAEERGVDLPRVRPDPARVAGLLQLPHRRRQVGDGPGVPALGTQDPSAVGTGRDCHMHTSPDCHAIPTFSIRRAG